MGIADAIRDNYNVVAFQYMGDSVTYTPVTKEISAMSGQEVLTKGASTKLTVNFKRIEKKWWFDKLGKIEGGDAIMYIPYNSVVKEDDEIIFLGNTYRVMSVLSVTSTGNTVVFKKCNMFLVN